MGHGWERGGAERLRVKVGVVELAEDLASFDLARRDLLFDVVEHHEEMLTFLRVAGVTVGHGHHGAVVLHDDGGEFKGDVQLLADGDEKVEFLGQGEDGAGFGMGR